MDVEEQILKHLPRDARKTVSVIDEYCQGYKNIFKEVRSYECFKYLHLGMISDIPRKSLPEIAKIVGINSAQSLHHFIANSPWSVKEFREKRLKEILRVLKGKKITLVIDETGDRKKGKKTDYVARQYLGSIGKIDNGIVSVNAYGIYENITFPLMFKIFKPKGTLKEGDKYKTKIEIASNIIEELVEFGFEIELVLTDSLYGESSSFLATLENYNLPYVVAIRSNHGVWMPAEHKVRTNKWFKFNRIFSDGKTETRYVREIVFGKRRSITYWQLTTDKENLPENSTYWIKTNIKGTLTQLKKNLGNLYGLRTWVEYGFRQCKQELGWTDYRFTKFKDIEKWWETIFSVYLMVSLNALNFLSQKQSIEKNSSLNSQTNPISYHKNWDDKNGWKNVLNNLRLIIKPSILLWLITPWLYIFPNQKLALGFHILIEAIASYQPFFLSG